MTEVAVDPIPNDPPKPRADGRTGSFTVRDIFHDRATLGKFTAVLGLHMGQVFPAAFFGLMLTASKTQAATDYTSFVVAATAAVAASLGIGGVVAQYLGWHLYFLVSGLFVTACCFGFYMLFDKIEAIVEARDIAELALEPHPTTHTTAGARHGIG